MPEGIRVTSSEKGKTPLRLSKNLRDSIKPIVDDALEIIRKNMEREAPAGTKDMRKYGQKHIRYLLSNKNLCIRKTSKNTGYVFVNQRDAPHLKYVLYGTKGHYITGNPLSFEWKGERVAFNRVWRPRVYPNNFISRAYQTSRGPISRLTKDRLLKAVRMK